VHPEKEIPRMTTIDETCPGCGARLGHPDPPLEDAPSPEGASELAQRVHEDVAAPTCTSRWVSKRTGPGMTTSRCIPLDAPCPEGWAEGGVF
jgi:hypothetical protein